MKCRRCRKQIQGDSVFCRFCGTKQQRSEGSKNRGNGSGTAFKRAGAKTWTARITVGYSIVDGKAVQRYRQQSGFKTKTEALAYCAKMESDISEKRVPTLEQYWNMYRDGQLANLSRDRITAYKKAWERFSAIHHKKVDTIMLSEVRACVESKSHTYYTSKDMRQLLTHLYKLAAADGFVDASLPSLIVLPKLTQTKREAFSQFEQAALWKSYECGDKRAAVPLLMIYTGMMPCEVRALKTENVDIQQQIITGVGAKTKIRQESPVFVPDCVIPLLIDMMMDKQSFLLPRDQKRFYRDYYASLESAHVRRLSPYCCRHTTATALAITEGIAPQTVQKVMRWSTSRMLDRYAHPSAQDAKTAVNAIKRSL